MANSKKKGNRGENQLVHILCEHFGEGEFKRTPSSGAYTGGLNRETAVNLPWEAKITLASDIICPANFNFIIEHKFYESMNFWDLLSDKSNWNEWIEQAEGDAKFVNKIPLLVIKYNRHQRIALVPYTYIISYASRYTDAIPLAKRFIWKGYSVVWLEDLLKLPREFWFTEEEGENG
jgi:hypothetical protein